MPIWLRLTRHFGLSDEAALTDNLFLELARSDTPRRRKRNRRIASARAIPCVAQTVRTPRAEFSSWPCNAAASPARPHFGYRRQHNHRNNLTVGNRERDLRTGFSIPFRLTLAGILQFAIRPMWGIDYVTHERFKLPQLDEHVDMRGGALSIGRYFTEMLDPSMNWHDVADMVRHWNGQFCLKGVMSVADAKRAVEIGCTGIVVSNHGGRQLDGSRASFDQLAEIVDAVGDWIDVLMDGGIQRGSHVLKALSVGAKAVGVGRYYLYPLAAAGQAGVERALGLLRTEIERDMKLMGCAAIGLLSRDNLRFR